MGEKITEDPLGITYNTQEGLGSSMSNMRYTMTLLKPKRKVTQFCKCSE